MRLADGPIAGRNGRLWPRLVIGAAVAILATAGAAWLAASHSEPWAASPTLPPKPVTSVLPPRATLPTLPKPTDGNDRVVLRTVAGDLVVVLHTKEAPDTVRQFLRLVRLGAYDSTHFGGLEPGFYLQLYARSQDRLLPTSHEIERELAPIPTEINPTRHRRGVLSLPGGIKPDSSAVEFSIMLGDAPTIDGHQTAFAHIETGLEVLDRLEQLPRYDGHRPTTRVTLLQAEIVTADALPSLVLEGPRSLADILALEPPTTLAVRGYALLKNRCVQCHGGDKTEGGLDVTSQAALFRGGKHGRAVYRGNGLNSPLRQRASATDHPVLSVAERSLLTTWLDFGAPYPPESDPLTIDDQREPNAVSAEDAAFWSFGPLKKVRPPDANTSASAVDRFLLAKLDAKGLTFDAEADRRTLIRRLSFDLIGLPPTPTEIDDFIRHCAPNAYENLVDRLLASPHYGERWGRHWLDLARYADSGGYEDDDDRPHAYFYRDFVIRALNDDLPFDHFVRWQIAGDELEPNNPRALAATGFVTAGPVQSFYPRKRDRYDELDDIVSTVGSALLGLTVGCSRCHDHKYDPIPTRDYYRLQAVFAGSRRDERPLPLNEVELQRQQTAQRDYFRDETERLRKTLIANVRQQRINDLPLADSDKTLLRLPVAPGNAAQAELRKQFGERLEVAADEMFLDPDDRVAYERLAKRLADLEAGKPPRALTLTGGLGRAFFLERGNPDRERETVPPGFLTVLTRGRPAWTEHTWEQWAPRSVARPYPQPRRALAEWLTDVDGGAGRLVARVVVNRLWQHHFGEGLVRTPNDFGTQGEPPTHPELLDFLAGELIEHAWSLKYIHRLIVTSAAYRQGIANDPSKLRADPDNRLWGRRRPQRLEAEALRDAMLTVSGSLNREMYGPAIKPPLPPEAIFPTAAKHGSVWPADAVDGPATWRRSIYVCAKRSNPVPFLQAYDAPDAAVSCGRRSPTTVPTQALILLNDPFVSGQARRFAEHVRAGAEDDPKRQVELAFRLALGRPPDAAEADKAARFLTGGSLAELCQVLFQTNEFTYID